MASMSNRAPNRYTTVRMPNSTASAAIHVAMALTLPVSTGTEASHNWCTAIRPVPGASQRRLRVTVRRKPPHPIQPMVSL